MPISKIKIGLIDDHILLRSALADLINTFDGCEVVMQCNNGIEMKNHIAKGIVPNILLLDLNMPEMNGYEAALWLKNSHPEIKTIMLTMYDAEATMIRLLQAGVKGFLKKDAHPNELRMAIQSLTQYGYYYSNSTTGKLVNLFRNPQGLSVEKNTLSEQEITFLTLTATDLTYKEIAIQLALNPRAVDNLRDHLFEKLDVKSRVGLALFAIKQGLVRF